MNPRRRPTRAWIWIASLAAAPGGCSYAFSPSPPGRPVAEVYAQAAGGADPAGTLRLEAAPAPGAAGRTRPVIYPPKVFAVWVPEHLDRERDFKIGAHWVYIKLRDSSWVEEPIDREPEASEPADPSDLGLLRERIGPGGPDRFLVPFEARPPGPATEPPRNHAWGGRP